MSAIENLENDEPISKASYPFTQSTQDNFVPLNLNRPIDETIELKVDSFVGQTANSITKEDELNHNQKSKPAGNQRGKASNALRQAKLNAKKQKAKTSSSRVIISDHLQPARDAKDCIYNGTGVIYDLRMVEHRNLWDLTHLERPERFTSIISRCTELGLLERCKMIAPRLASFSEILEHHTYAHIEKLQEICDDPDVDDIEKLEDKASRYDAIYFHPTTYELALLSCGSTIDLIQNIVDGNIQNGMAIVRPPGHHAMKEEYCGYCYFNNVAIAATKILNTSELKRILIVDYDVHHGQATQQMFYNDPRVLYFSTHRFEHGTFWPNLEESNYNWIGTEDGFGFNCNIPLNKTGLGNGDFLSVWYKILLPMAYQFSPELVIVSAGYDAALGCPEGEMKMTPQCYPHLLWPLKGLANGKLAVILEGGYCLKSLSEGAALSLRALLGDPCPFISPISTPDPVIAETILNATAMLKDCWNFPISRFSEVDELDTRVQSGKAHLPKYRFDWTQPKPTKYPTQNACPFQTEETKADIDAELNRLMLTTSLSIAEHKVGLVYDDSMLRHRNLTTSHPECPDRISDIFACHVSFGLVERCHRIDCRKATTEELLLIHSEEHILKMTNTARLGSKDLVTLGDRYNSIYFNNYSFDCALLAAGSLLNVVDSVLRETCQAGVAIVRPPGHHAEVDEACGFCLFNNVSLAAKYAVENFQLKRILVIDWDVHHGNGIQHMFYDDPRVLYISIHRYDHGSFFPGKTDANYTAIGEGPGEGFNINIPWNKKGMGDTEYFTAFTNVILPIAYQYAPELVLVSAGFDAAEGDMLGGCKVSPEGYAHMTNLLQPLANGKIILALEGGYNLTSIAYSMSLCTKVLLGDPFPPLTLNSNMSESAIESISNVLDIHSKYWSVLEPFQRVLPISSCVKPGNYKIHSEADLTEALNQLTLDESDVDQNLNLPGRQASRIPDPPISAGEPSLSLPRLPSPPRSNRPGTQETEIAVGAGELASSSNIAAAMEDLELEGAVGGTNSAPNFAIQITIGEEEGMYAVQPLSWCPHLTSVNAVPPQGINVLAPCEDCGSTEENWICLDCYSVKCSRYIRSHMLSHSEEAGHSMALSFSDLSVWCFPCDSYVDCLDLDEAKGAAYLNKFGTPLPPRGD